jgi:hypothetical protein
MTWNMGKKMMMWLKIVRWTVDPRLTMKKILDFKTMMMMTMMMRDEIEF